MAFEDKVETFLAMQRRVQHAKKVLKDAEDDLRSVTIDLGKAMMPKAPISGRPYCIWVSGRPFGVGEKRDVLLEVVPRFHGETVPQEFEITYDLEQ